MKYTRLFFVFIVFFILQNQDVKGAAWLGEYATKSWDFVCYDNVNNALLAVVDSDIYRSTDKGKSWNPVNNPPFEYVQSMIATAQGVIARTSGRNLYKTTDAGISWMRIGARDISAVGAFSANDSGVIFVDTSSGVMVSCDAGLSWTSIPDSHFEESSSVEDVHVDKDGFLYMADYWFSVYRSLDNGSTWEKSSKKFNSSPCCIASAPDGTVYVGTYWDGVFKSEDHGSTWTNMSNGLPKNRGVSSITVCSANNLYALVDDQCGTLGLYRFDTSADSWKSAGGGLTVNQMRDSGVSATDGNLIWLTQGYHGIGCSSDGGESWAGFKASIPQNVISMCPTSNNVLYVGCNQPYIFGPNSDAMGVFMSSDQGDTWIDLNEGLDEFDMAVQGITIANNNSIIVLPYSPGNLLRRKDFNTQWERQEFDNISTTFGSIYKSKNGTLLIGNYWEGVHSSLDGCTWNILDDGWPDGFGSGVIAMDSEGVIYADCGGQNGRMGLYRYTANDNWVGVWSPEASLSALLTTKENNVLAATDSEIYISYDKGNNWETYSNGLPSGSGAYAFIETCDGTIYAAIKGSTCGVYRLQKKNDHWESMDFPINRYVTKIYSLAFMKGYLFAGTNNGVFRFFVNNCMDYPIDLSNDLDGNGEVGLSDVILGLRIITSPSNDESISIGKVLRIFQKISNIPK